MFYLLLEIMREISGDMLKQWLTMAMKGAGDHGSEMNSLALLCFLYGHVVLDTPGNIYCLF